MKRIVIGFGSGRCGTVSLGALLSMQGCIMASHEFRPLLPWDGAHKLALDKVATMLRRPAEMVADVAYYWLPYLRRLLEEDDLDIRCVGLVRDREETVASFLRKVPEGMNHWQAPNRLKPSEWDACFPQYPHLPRMEDAIRQYWKDYYARAVRLENDFPDRVRVWPMEGLLGTEAMQAALFNFIGVPPDNATVVLGIHQNATVL